MFRREDREVVWRFPNLPNSGIGEVVGSQFQNADRLVEYFDQQDA